MQNHLNNVTSNEDMFVGCSEISINVTVKHVKHIRIIKAFCQPGGLIKYFST